MQIFPNQQPPKSETFLVPSILNKGYSTCTFIFSGLVPEMDCPILVSGITKSLGPLSFLHGKEK
jgi:hypothetical protein